MVIDVPKPAKTGFTAFGGGGQSLRGKNKGYSLRYIITKERSFNILFFFFFW
jgi:hypothetical protein